METTNSTDATPEDQRSVTPPPATELIPGRDYLRSIKGYLIIITTLFFISIAVGYSVGASMGEPASEGTIEQLRQILGWIVDLPPISMALFIFANNAIKCLLIIPLGAVLGLVPLLFILVNGAMLGLIAFGVEGTKGVAFVLASLLPHGVLEIPALLMSSAIGLRMGYAGFRRLRGLGSLRQELGKGLKVYVRWMLPVLFLAAIVETFVTPAVASLFS